jgi:ribosomal protein L11 methyltransferase
LPSVSRFAEVPGRLRIVVAVDEIDAVSGQLWMLDTLGIEERPTDDPNLVELVAGFDLAEQADAAATHFDRFTVVEEIHNHEQLLAAWREHASPMKAGNRIVVRPPWVGYDLQPCDLVLHIDPGPVFGSGSHETTRLALAELEVSLEGNERVLDVGCGSGVLAIAAARLGAVDVVAVDIDPAAPDITMSNARRNGVTEFIAASDRPLSDVDGVFNVVVANILAVVLIELGPELVSRVAENGRLVLAGLLRRQIDDVVSAMSPLRTLHETSAPGHDGTGDPDSDWVCLVLG